METSGPNTINFCNNKYFSPECLTISLGSDCNLNCLYCFSNQNETPKSKVLKEKDFLMSIKRASELVAAQCQQKNKPFYLGYQGSGEPLNHFNKLKRSYQLVKSVVQDHGIKLYSFITSNGCMGNEKYHWLAANFNRVCLSVDGDEHIHDLHRQTRNKKGTYRQIVETLKIFNQYEISPVIRTTVTHYNVQYLASIVSHFINELNVFDIQVEPVYRLQNKKKLWPEPESFVENYLQAKKIAIMSGGRLSYSGYRKDENHGPYCNTNKKVLFIGPGGTASICLFKDNEDKESSYAIGHYDIKGDRFIIDNRKINELRKKINRDFADCKKCEISNSCVKGCPDICLIENEIDSTLIHESLRCQINLLLYRKEIVL